MAVIPKPTNTPEAWSARAARERDSWTAAGWTENGQRDRFAKVLAALKPQSGETLFDYGCGTGALSEMLPNDVDYVGFDTASGMVVRAAREHPGRRFQSWEPTFVADIVACVGPFNLADRWSKQHTWWKLRGLWEKTGRALAVCLYAGNDANCITYTDAECEAFGRELGFGATVERIRPNDLMLVVNR